jgi:hypothetical protein
MSFLVRGGWVALSLILVLTGCSSDNPVYPVRGKVTFDGKPMVGGGSISLVPLSDQPGMAAGGLIGEDGSYILSTYGDGDGSMVGEFRVLIYQVTEQEPVRTEDGQRAAKPLSLPAADRIPVIYADPQNSPLRATVEARSANEINFDLKRM